jgi:uncharacterized protein
MVMGTQELQARGHTPPTATPDGVQPGASAPSVRTFFVLTFVLGWGAGILMTVFQEQVESVFGPIGYTNPVFILVVYSPAFAGVYLIWRHYGSRGLGRFFRRFALWRMPAAWWALLVGIPAVYYVAAAIGGTLGDPFPYSPWYGVLPALLLTLGIGPVEELGWRGVAQPLLQRRFAPFWSALVVGTVWAVWHLPAFFLMGTKQSGWDLGPFLIGVIAVAVIVTPMFNASKGSLLIPALFHFQLNGPAWPDAQPWDMYLFAAIAIVVVLVNRESMFSREGAATELLANDDG